MNAFCSASNQHAYDRAQYRNDYEYDLRATQNAADQITDLRNSISTLRECIAAPDWHFGCNPQLERASLRKSLAVALNDLAYYEAQASA